MKRVISIILVVAMLCSMCVTTTFAAEKVTLKIETATTSAKVGDNVTFTISLDGTTTKKAAAVGFNIDVPADLEYVSHTLASGLPTNATYTSRTGTFGFYDGQKTAPVKLMEVTFKVKDTTTYGKKVISFKNDDDLAIYDENDESFDVTLGKQEITILKAPLTAVSATVSAPVKGAALDTTGTVASGAPYTVTKVEWFEGASASGTAVTGNAKAKQIYTAQLTVKANDGESFAASLNGKKTADGYTVARKSDTLLTLTNTFAATADKDEPICAAPTGLTATYGQKLSDITLTNAAGNTPGTWSWMSPTQSVGDVGTRTFKARFTPNDTANYATKENVDVSLTVNAKELTDVSVDNIAAQTYTGSQLKPAVTVKGDSGKTLVLNRDYTVTYGENTNAGSGSVTVKAKAGSNYTFADVTKSFVINKAAVAANVQTQLKAAVQFYGAVYDGAAHAAVTVATLPAGWTLAGYSTDGTAYAAAVPQLKNVADSKTVYVKFTNSNYSDYTVSGKAAVTAKELTGSMVVLGEQATYDGSAHGAVYTVKDGTAVLALGTDYTVQTSQVTNVGENTLVVTGKGNYTGVASVKWSLKAKNIADVTADAIAAQTYTGSAIEPTLTMKNGAAALTKGTDYTVAYADNTNVGVAAVTVTGKGNYTGTRTINFTINAKDVTRNAGTTDQMVVVNVGTFNPPTFGAVTGTLTYSYDGATGYDAVVAKLAALPLDATGEIGYTYTANGNYTGTITGKIAFRVVNLPAATITTPPAAKTGLVYNGSEQVLISAGSGVTGGTLQYKLEGGVYSTELPKATNADSYTVYYKAVGNNTTHSDSAEQSIVVTIGRKTVTAAVTVEQASYAYTGSPIEPAVTVKDGATVIAASEYTVSYANNTNVGAATVTVASAAGGNYDVTGSARFTIVKAQPAYTLPTGLTATYGQTLADVALPAGWSWMNPAESVGDASAAAKTFKAKFTPDDTANYEVVSNVQVSLTVNKAAASAPADIAVSQRYTLDTEQSKTLTGLLPANAGAQTYTVGMPDMTGVNGSSTLMNVTVANGTLKYTVLSGTIGDVIRIPVTVASTNYEDVTVNVVITLTDRDAQAELIYSGATSVVFGNTLTLSVRGGSTNGTVTYVATNGTGEATVSGNVLTAVKTGSVTVTATMAGNTQYSDVTSAPVTITIEPKNISGVTVETIDAQTYTGSAIEPAVTVRSGSTGLTAGTDYTVTYADNTEAGRATATITGMGNYTGTKTVNFTINKAAPAVTAAPTANTLTYNGGAQALIAAGTAAGGEMQYSLTQNGTYSSAIPTGTDAKTYTVWYKVVGDRNHTNTDAASVSVTIAPKSVTAVVTLSQDSYTYTGRANMPAVTVKDGGTVIPAGEYTVTYTDNTNAGTATVTISDKDGGNYNVTGTATFTIAKADSRVSVSIGGWTYKDAAKTPTVSGNVGGGAVTFLYKTAGADDSTYTATVPAAAGSYTVKAVVAESANYAAATATANFTIAARNIGSAGVNDIADQEFAKVIEPAVTVTDGGVLTEGTDYTVTYRNNTDAGTASVVITGKGNYTGTKTVNFTIKALAKVDAPVVVDNSGAAVTRDDVTKDNLALNADGLAKYNKDSAGNVTTDKDVILANVKKAMSASADSAFIAAAVTGNDKADTVLPYPDGADKSKNITVKKLAADGTITNVTPTKMSAGLKLELQDGAMYLISWTTPSSGGSGSSYPAGKTFRTDLPAGTINKVTVNGKTLSSKYYTVSGSDVTLLQSYLDTLKAGKYTVKIENATHVSTGTFTITKSGSAVSPRTFDAGVAMYAAMAVASVTGMAWLGKKKED